MNAYVLCLEGTLIGIFASPYWTAGLRICIIGVEFGGAGVKANFVCTHIGRKQCGHKPGHARGTAGFYCEVGRLEEVGGVEEVFVVVGA